MDRLTVSLGRVVARRREAQGLSWRTLGARCGVSGNTVRNLERGVRSSRVNVVARIARGLGVPLWRLIREAERVDRGRGRATPARHADGNVSDAAHSPPSD